MVKVKLINNNRQVEEIHKIKLKDLKQAKEDKIITIGKSSYIYLEEAIIIEEDGTKTITYNKYDANPILFSTPQRQKNFYDSYKARTIIKGNVLNKLLNDDEIKGLKTIIYIALGLIILGIIVNVFITPSAQQIANQILIGIN